MHSQKAVDSVLLLFCDVVQAYALFQHTRVDTDKAHGTGLGVYLDLEDQSKEGTLLVVGDFHILVLLLPVGFYRRNLARRWQKIDNTIQETLNANVLE